MPDVRRASPSSTRFFVLALAVLLVVGCHAATEEPSFPTPSPAPVSTPTFAPRAVRAPLDLTPPDTSASLSSAPLRVGGYVIAPIETRRVQPVFPDRCTSSRFQGPFIFEAVISASGRISGLRTLRTAAASPPCPEAEPAVREALAQWQYKPATYRGQAVAVYLTITVSPHYR
ncbi:hypothetical protein EG835_01230 [bacterium]|nr:hypothetical protein [bacterium]